MYQCFQYTEPGAGERPLAPVLRAPLEPSLAPLFGGPPPPLHPPRLIRAIFGNAGHARYTKSWVGIFLRMGFSSRALGAVGGLASCAAWKACDRKTWRCAERRIVYGPRAEALENDRKAQVRSRAMLCRDRTKNCMDFLKCKAGTLVNSLCP